MKNVQFLSVSVRSLLGGVMALTLSAVVGGAQAGKTPVKTLPYTYYSVGSVGNPGTLESKITLVKPAYPSYVLMGGGPDVDGGFRWMITKAGITPASGGRLVVIRTTGDGAYDPYIYYSNRRSSVKSADIIDGWVGGASQGLTSVETLVIPSTTAADDPIVNAIVANANAVWIAGGDQSTYIKFWKGRKLEATLKSLMQANVPIGGTSAGLAVMGGFDYSALNASATSPLALQNPYHADITFDPNPLSTSGGFIAPAVFQNVIFDSHFDSRDRMGRLIAFVSRIIGTYPGTSLNSTFGCPGGVLGNSVAKGIGIGVETALLVEGNAQGTYTGQRVTNVSTTTESAVYFIDVTQGPTQCAAGKTLEIPASSIVIRKLKNSASSIDLPNIINLSDWSSYPIYQNVGATSGVLVPASPY
jgi:cyanophycinase-like exopeptidase